MTTFLIDGETALDAGSLTEALPLLGPAPHPPHRPDPRALRPHRVAPLPDREPLRARQRRSRSRPRLRCSRPCPATSSTTRPGPTSGTFPPAALPDRGLPPLAVGRPFRAGGVSFITPLPSTTSCRRTATWCPSRGARSFSRATRCPTTAIWARAAARAGSEGDLSGGVLLGRAGRRGAASCHLTPRLLPAEIAKAPARVPVYLYHMKPPSLSRIRREVDALGEPRLQPARVGEVVSVLARSALRASAPRPGGPPRGSRRGGRAASRCAAGLPGRRRAPPPRRSQVFPLGSSARQEDRDSELPLRRTTDTVWELGVRRDVLFEQRQPRRRRRRPTGAAGTRRGSLLGDDSATPPSSRAVPLAARDRGERRLGRRFGLQVGGQPRRSRTAAPGPAAREGARPERPRRRRRARTARRPAAPAAARAGASEDRRPGPPRARKTPRGCRDPRASETSFRKTRRMPERLAPRVPELLLRHAAPKISISRGPSGTPPSKATCQPRAGRGGPHAAERRLDDSGPRRKQRRQRESDVRDHLPAPGSRRAGPRGRSRCAPGRGPGACETRERSASASNAATRAKHVPPVPRSR